MQPKEKRRAWRRDVKFRNHHNKEIVMPLIPKLHHIKCPSPLLRSGMVTAFGIVLKVDRCAPEHGGGIIFWTPLTVNGHHLTPEDHVHIYGAVDAPTLAALREASRATTGHDYSKSIR